MKIYFASIETRLEQLEQVGGVDYALTTFYYLRGKGEKQINRV